MSDQIQLLTRDYINKHQPDKEFDYYDFDRVAELARFGWVVIKAVMDNATEIIAEKGDPGLPSMKVPVEFEIEPATVEDDDGVFRTLCIDTRVRIRVASDMLPNHDVVFTMHQPCLEKESGGAWVRRPRKVRRPQER